MSSADSDLTPEDLRRVLEIVDQGGFDRIEIEIDGLHIVAEFGDPGPPGRAGAPGTPSRSTAGQPRPGNEGREDIEPGWVDLRQVEMPAAESADPASADAAVAVVAPVGGVFYRSPSPGEPAFVEVGDVVAPGDTVGLLEVMKLFSAVESPCAGTVGEFVVEDSQAVSRGDTLLNVRP